MPSHTGWTHRFVFVRYLRDNFLAGVNTWYVSSPNLNLNLRRSVEQSDGKQCDCQWLHRQDSQGTIFLVWTPCTMYIPRCRCGTPRAGPACTHYTGTLPQCGVCISMQQKLSLGPGTPPWGCGMLRWVGFADKGWLMLNFCSDWGVSACAGRPRCSSEVRPVRRQAGRQRGLWLHGQGEQNWITDPIGTKLKKKLKTDERSPKVWNPEREECLHTLSGHTNRVYSLQVNFNVWVKILTLEWTPHKLLGGTLYWLFFRNHETGV